MASAVATARVTNRIASARLTSASLYLSRTDSVHVRSRGALIPSSAFSEMSV
jgi:hypothetical protein